MCFIYYDIRYLYYSQIGDVIRDILSKSNFLISDPEFWLKQIIDVWPDPEANPQWPAKKDNYGGDCKENIILFYVLFYFGGGRGFGERELHVTENYSRHLLSPDAELLQAQVERVWWSLSATLHSFYCLLLRTTKSGSGWSEKKHKKTSISIM